MSGCEPGTWGSVHLRPSTGTAGLQVLLRQQYMWPLCPLWSAMQTTNGAPRPPVHPSRRHSRDTPEESLPWLPALSSSPRNPRTLVPSVSLVGTRQAPTSAQAPPSGRGAVARAGAGRRECSAGRKCSWAFPRGRLPTRRSPGAQIRPGPHHLLPLGERGERNLLYFFLEASRSCQVWTSDPGSTLGFSWQGWWILLFHRQLSVHSSVAWLLL